MAAFKYRLTITVSDKYFAVGSGYPKRPGEDWERGNDIADGNIQDIGRVIDLLTYLIENPEKRPGDWKHLKSVN